MLSAIRTREVLVRERAIQQIVLTLAVTLLAGCRSAAITAFAPQEPACELTYVKRSICQGAAISPRGDLVACFSAMDSLGRFTPEALRIIDVSTGESRVVLRDTLGFGLFDGVHWSPDGKTLLLRTGNLFLSKFDVASGELEFGFIQEVPPGRWHSGGVYTPNGDSLYYVASFNFQDESRHVHGLRVASKDGYGVHWVPFESESLWYFLTPVTFARQSSKMAFARWKDRPPFPVSICTANRDGSDLREIVEVPGEIQHMYWLDHDRTLAFDYVSNECVGPFATRHTYLLDLSSHQIRRSPVDLGDTRVQFGLEPQFTDDQQKLAFIGLDARLGYGVLQIMNVNGSDRRSIYAPKEQSPPTPVASEPRSIALGLFDRRGHQRP